MTNVATQVLATVNAPYGANLTAHQLAAMIADPKSVKSAPVFAFFSEVSAPIQKQFIAEMDVDAAKAGALATRIARLSGYKLPLAA
ncbi:hypothetical protein F9288_16990 [Sphingomonas sp. CL5.1]|uniref:hypothetical protein n=1 Tax=Sphingomonas sp. CL5.1 TaxID=2653203 RepID=UPI001582CDED|nr:hypothetical protein [Sphingomonas sp. CL5.1]QKS01133.1 hypothetical protein F9288_16990 [Sphingomonas sp. CL5.1]